MFSKSSRKMNKNELVFSVADKYFKSSFISSNCVKKNFLENESVDIQHLRI